LLNKKEELSFSKKLQADQHYEVKMYTPDAMKLSDKNLFLILLTLIALD